VETAKGWCYFMAGGEMYRTNGTKSELCEDIELREVPEEKAAPDRAFPIRVLRSANTHKTEQND
jgi:hypothetical protein